jgi:Tol biopolymer transport system component/DNA-binding winged helix-turn-helix (wHTH) protein
VAENPDRHAPTIDRRAGSSRDEEGQAALGSRDDFVMLQENAIFESRGLRIDTAAYRAELDGRVLSLEPKAFDLLVLLVSRAGQLVTKQQILDTVWSGTAVTDNALTRVVAQLRKALGDDAREARFLETVPTRGYRWLAPVAVGGQTGVGAGSDQGQTGVRTGSESRTAATQPVESIRSSKWGWLGVAFGVLVAIGLVSWIALDRRATVQPRPLFPRQSTLTSGLDVYPAISPDGRRIAYSSDRSGKWEIYIKPTDSAVNEFALTADGQNNLHAAWSPDGRLIAYHSITRGGIWIISIDGGQPRQASTFGSQPAWAPDSRRIAFQSEPAADIGPNARAANLPSTIWMVDIGRGQPRPLTRRGIPIGGHGAPTWSPDGRHVAFATADFAIAQVWAVNIEGGEPHLLSEPRGVAFDPLYLPDGRSVVFPIGGPTIGRIALDANGRRTGAVSIITVAGLDNLRHFSVSRDGNLAVSALTMRTALWSMPIDRNGRPAGEPRALTDDTRPRNSLPTFSPDGSRIALMSSVKGEQPDIWLIRPDGSGLKQLTANPTHEAMPNWLPDARHVTFKSLRDGHAELWQVNVETLEQQRLVDFGTVEDVARKQGFVQEAKISPDGKRLVYALLDPRTSTKAIYVRGLADENAIRVTTGDPPASYPTWSPDGQWIACELQTANGAVTAVVPASGGTPQPLTTAAEHSWVHGWSPASDRVLFAGQRDGVWNVYWVARAGGPEQRVTNLTGVRTFVRYPTWSPRGDQIVYEYGDIRGNVWLLNIRP